MLYKQNRLFNYFKSMATNLRIRAGLIWMVVGGLELPGATWRQELEFQIEPDGKFKLFLLL